MSLLRIPRTLNLTRTRTTHLSPTTTNLQRKPFSMTARSLVGKESAIHGDAESRAQEAEKTKQEELAKQKKGENEWREEIASDSESALQADKGKLDASEEGVKKLQDETKGRK